MMIFVVVWRVNHIQGYDMMILSDDPTQHVEHSSLNHTKSTPNRTNLSLSSVCTVCIFGHYVPLFCRCESVNMVGSVPVCSYGHKCTSLINTVWSAVCKSVNWVGSVPVC
jgi:hypothetical protein